MVVARTSLSLGTSTYTLTLQGLNPNGGDNTMLVDAVKLNGVLVPNGGFETPVLPFASYMMNPVGATWSFIGTSGISRNGSGFSAKANAPEGLQAGIVEMSGSISQQLSLASGSYTFSFQAVQRPIGNATYQQVRATLQDTATHRHQHEAICLEWKLDCRRTRREQQRHASFLSASGAD